MGQLQFVLQALSLLVFIGYQSVIACILAPWLVLRNAFVSARDYITQGHKLTEEADTDSSCFYEGTVDHIRRKPRPHAFKSVLLWHQHNV